MNQEQKKIVKKINQAYSKLYILSTITWTPYRDELFKINKQDEKKHRRGDWSSHHNDAAPISDCARLFTVKHIAESLLNPNRWQVKDLLNIKKSCLYAQSVVNNYKERIKKAWIDENIKYLAELDYISLVDWNLHQDLKKKHKEVA